MAMTIVVTRNLPGRFRGFLASCMCEIAPGVYTAPKMSTGVRERIWKVVSEWFQGEEEQSLLMTWPDPDLPGGQQVRALGIPRQDLHDYGGVFLARRDLSDDAKKKLQRDRPHAGGPDVTEPVGPQPVEP